MKIIKMKNKDLNISIKTKKLLVKTEVSLHNLALHRFRDMTPKYE